MSVPLRRPPRPAVFEAFAEMVHQASGIVLTADKRVLVETRLSPWIQAGAHRDLDGFLQHLVHRATAAERSRVFERLATHTTAFFREPHHFELLARRMVPERAPVLPETHPLRVWSAACSSGEEPYSLAMCLAELRTTDRLKDYRVLATDLSRQILSSARRAIYPAHRMDGLTPERRTQWFEAVRVGEQPAFRVRSELRKRVSFHPLNLVRKEWRLRHAVDIVFCRNVLIYFDPETRRRVVRRLVSTLDEGGFLVLGHSDTGVTQGLPLEAVGPTTYRYLGVRGNA